MRVRRVARRLALDVLYEAEIRDRLPVDAWKAHRVEGWVMPTPGDDEVEPTSVDDDLPHEATDYAWSLVEGVQAHQADIDRLIAQYADRWAIERMPVVDRSLLRIAIYELLWRTDIPVPVAINEAVELAQELSTDDSGRFINGLLGRIVEQEAVR
jgi:transcription antitermination protein NusB